MIAPLTAAVAARITKALLAKMTIGDVATLCGVSIEAVREIAQQIRAREAQETPCDDPKPVPR
jgi:hypothetical protein